MLLLNLKNTIMELGHSFSHAFQGYAVYLAFAGIFCAWFLYLLQPQLAERLKQKLQIPYKVLMQ